VEPVYLEAKQEMSEAPAQAPAKPGLFGKTQGKAATASSRRATPGVAALPELKRVIVAFGNRLVMGENLDMALASVLDYQIITEKMAPASIPRTDDTLNLGLSALEHYNKAKGYMRQGKWAEYGKELENLEQVLKEIASKTEDKR